VIQRLNRVVPGRWRQQFQSVPADLIPAGTRRIYLACRLIVTLPVEKGAPDVDAVYEDLGEMDQGSLAGVKVLYSDARKRAAVAAVPPGSAPTCTPRSKPSSSRSARTPGRYRRSAARARATCSSSRPRPSSGCDAATRPG
jgi:hypothetical protein